MNKIVFLDIDGVISPAFEGEFAKYKDEYERTKPRFDSGIYAEKAKSCILRNSALKNPVLIQYLKIVV